MKNAFVFSICAAMTLLAACNESGTWTPNTDCSDAEARCDSDKLYTCKDGEWVLDANCADSGMVCGQNAENQPACVSGPKEECVPSCKDGVVTLCDSDGNAMTHQCTEEQVCGLSPQGTPDCVTLPQKSCMPYCRNNGIVTCDENMNEVYHECIDNKICEMDENHQPACVEKKSCQPSCVNGVLTTCDAEMNEVTKSCSDDNKVCGFDENGVPACVAKQACLPLCKDGQLTICDQNMVASTKICGENEVCGLDDNGVPVCVAKSAAVVCAFGETNVLVGTKVCDAEGKVMECQADGTMSEGTACTAGVCAEGECVRRACDDVADGKNVCKANKLMVCNDGELVEDTENACGTDTPLCRDGEFECSAYKDCDTIEHGKNGCKDGNIVTCNDGKTSVLTDGNCVELSKVCVADVEAEAGYICKTPDPTDCTLNGVTIAKNETICDGNVLKTCSTEIDGVLSDGVDCASVNNGKPYCDPKLNICRDYYKCGDNDEIKHDSIACNAKGTNKAKCVDGKLVDLTDDDACVPVDNANTVCTYDTEAACSFVCKPGYFLKNDACEPIVTCDAVKEKYNSDDNTCSCNTDAHWTGTAGNCDCAEGYLKIGNTCEEKKTCSGAHNVLDETTNTCVCDFNGNWIGKADSCQCKDGFVEISGECKAVVPCSEAHTVSGSEPNTCVCDASKGWTGEAGSCACADGFTEVGDLCVRKVVCNANETWVQTDNTCACNTEKGWTGMAGSCTCADSSKVPAGDKCEDKVTCSVGQMYVNGLNVCACDSAKGWISNGTECVCPNGYFANDSGVCTFKPVCDPYKEVYVPDDNTCVCNEAGNWTGTAGSCQCKEDAILVGFACETKQECDPDKERWVRETNTCVCDESRHWVEKSGSCACAGDGLFHNQCLVRGENIVFGHYEQDGNVENGKEPIAWQFFNVEGDKLILLSKYILDIKQFYSYDAPGLMWGASELRSWLNGYSSDANALGTDYSEDNFISSAFTDEEKQEILLSSTGSEMEDYIYLLSYGEARQYIFLMLASEMTPYVLQLKNSSCTKNCYGDWWIRTHYDGGYNTRFYFVSDSGLILNDVSGRRAPYILTGVRPVLRVKSDSLVCPFGEKYVDNECKTLE